MTQPETFGFNCKDNKMELRKHPRKNIDLEVELSYPEEVVIVHTRDISDGGMFLILDGVKSPPVMESWLM